MTTATTTTNGDTPKALAPKANGRIATLESDVTKLREDLDTVTDLITTETPSVDDERIKTLETRLDTVIWLHAELAHRLKMAALQRLLSTPDVQQKLLAQLEAGGTPLL